MSFFLKENRPLRDKDRKEFLLKRFKENNKRILSIGLFLTVEQCYYAFFVPSRGVLEQRAHLISACVMLMFVLVSSWIVYSKKNKSNTMSQLYELSFPLFGMLVAVYRTLMIHHEVFRLPTVYIAVIYGAAVIFYLSPIQSGLMYGLGSLTLILFLPITQPLIVSSSYIPDIISNAMIAWIASVINYSYFKKDFVNKKCIEENIIELNEKNKQITYMNTQLREMTVKDSLTGLYNRRKLDHELKCIYEETRDSFAVIILDVDHFKKVNDTHGHKAGDVILKLMAELLESSKRRKDILGRWGGEEFMLVCPETSLGDALKLAERLRSKIEQHDFPIVDHLTASFGVSRRRLIDDLDQIVTRADIALYEAKDNNRNCVCYSDKEEIIEEQIRFKI